jgi:hypothetical protein
LRWIFVHLLIVSWRQMFHLSFREFCGNCYDADDDYILYKHYFVFSYNLQSTLNMCIVQTVKHPNVDNKK